MTERMCEKSCEGFAAELASASPVPGGGGASAYVGALAAALGQMVGNLTLGKKKYAQYEDDIKTVMGRLALLQDELLTLVDADAEGFLPLSEAYGIPKDAPGRDDIMEAALRTACKAPLSMMKCAAEIVELLSVLCEKGSALAKSDVGVGATCAVAAMKGASLNIFINAKSMRDREYANELLAETNTLLVRYVHIAEGVFSSVVAQIR